MAKITIDPKAWINKLPPYMRNKFLLVLVGYFVYMLFFDTNDIPSQIKLRRQANSLQKQHSYYSDLIDDVKFENDKLFSSKETMEKFAREEYWMKKPNEDLFIIDRK